MVERQELFRFSLQLRMEFIMWCYCWFWCLAQEKHTTNVQLLHSLLVTKSFTLPYCVVCSLTHLVQFAEQEYTSLICWLPARFIIQLLSFWSNLSWRIIFYEILHRKIQKHETSYWAILCLAKRTTDSLSMSDIEKGFGKLTTKFHLLRWYTRTSQWANDAFRLHISNDFIYLEDIKAHLTRLYTELDTSPPF